MIRFLSAAILLLAAAAPSQAQIWREVTERAGQVMDTAEKVGAAVVPISTAQEIDIAAKLKDVHRLLG